MDNIYKNSDSVTLYQGDCVETMRTLPDNSVDSIVTDPPYELGFMNKSWDSTGIANNVEMWKECLRVLKPGGHLLSFGGTRTYHRMACAIEDAGFEIRDQMQWLYGSGFPKSMNIGKAIDKQLGHTPIDIGESPNWRESKRNREQFGKMEVRGENAGRITIPASPQGEEWQGWGTCLKPANEPICLARKPISEKTIAENVLKWGTGGINIDDCRIGTEVLNNGYCAKKMGYKSDEYGASGVAFSKDGMNTVTGRFPANIILDEEAGRLLDAQSGKVSYGNKKGGYNYTGNEYEVDGFIKSCKPQSLSNYGDTGGASRFFYCAKASKSERNAGLNGMEKKTAGSLNFRNPSASGRSEDAPSVAAMGGLTKAQENHHPTVKPVKLMEYLIKLITPQNGIVLDPFMGSGSTGIASKNLGFRFIGIEMEKEYCEIAQKRIAFASSEQQLNILDAI